MRYTAPAVMLLTYTQPVRRGDDVGDHPEPLADHVVGALAQVALGGVVVDQVGQGLSSPKSKPEPSSASGYR